VTFRAPTVNPSDRGPVAQVRFLTGAALEVAGGAGNCADLHATKNNLKVGHQPSLKAVLQRYFFSERQCQKRCCSRGGRARCRPGPVALTVSSRSCGYDRELIGIFDDDRGPGPPVTYRKCPPAATGEAYVPSSSSPFKPQACSAVCSGGRRRRKAARLPLVEVNSPEDKSGDATSVHPVCTPRRLCRPLKCPPARPDGTRPGNLLENRCR